ncbi:MAG TPA: translation initiation factor IF-2, partial [Acidimicrobiaceae bacterium]|nr:translation initiation factor IF-2 [Acidimicrobiaceae bacterium]
EQEKEILRDLDVDFGLDGDDLGPRPPVITVMGHVDHGKTLLLDRIRSANVADSEAGGITQHIGAYRVERHGRHITFIDTPGHEAFTAMRARGAQATDIVILVVAADDGVMPQTIEAIEHARAAEAPIVVAVNKMDRPGADLDRVLAQLSEQGLVPESYGGDVVTVPVSALESEGIDDLLDQILLVAELEELAASTTGRARGLVLEAHLDKGRGPVATVLVQHGTLSIGDPIVAGAAWGRIRAMTDDRGRPLAEAGPSTPVEVLGLGEVARSGDMFIVAPDEKRASRAAETREHWQRQALLARSAGSLQAGAKLEDIFKQVQAGETATLNLVLKADVHGSLEAITDALRKLERRDVRLVFVSRGVGGISENDVQLAIASNASIIGFNVRPDRKARQVADVEGVEMRLYEIIYRLIEDVQNAMVGMLAPEFEEIVTGEAQVRQVFRIARLGPVAGCVVEHGSVKAGAKVRFLRDGTVIWKGGVKSLRHFKDDVAEVSAGMECGIGLSDFTDLKEGDVIETYDEREIARV